MRHGGAAGAGVALFAPRIPAGPTPPLLRACCLKICQICLSAGGVVQRPRPGAPARGPGGRAALHAAQGGAGRFVWLLQFRAAVGLGSSNVAWPVGSPLPHSRAAADAGASEPFLASPRLLPAPAPTPLPGRSSARSASRPTPWRTWPARAASTTTARRAGISVCAPSRCRSCNAAAAEQRWRELLAALLTALPGMRAHSHAASPPSPASSPPLQDCWRGYIQTAIDGGPSCLDLRCPDPECKAAVPRSVMTAVADAPHRERCAGGGLPGGCPGCCLCLPAPSGCRLLAPLRRCGYTHASYLPLLSFLSSLRLPAGTRSLRCARLWTTSARSAGAPPRVRRPGLAWLQQLLLDGRCWR